MASSQASKKISGRQPRELQTFNSALKQVLSASPANVRAANAAAKAEKFSSHSRFVPRRAKAS